MNGATLIVFGRIFPILVAAPLFIPWQRPIEGLEGLEKLEGLGGFLGDCHYTLGSDADYFYLKTKKN